MASNGSPANTSGSDFLSTTRSNISTPSTQSYDNLCKVVLARRTRNMLSLTAVAAYAGLLLAVFDPSVLPGSLFNFLPAILCAPIAFLGTLPLFVLRKQTITLPQPPSPTKFSQYSHLRDRSTLRVFLTYLAGAGLFHFAYVWCAGSVSKEARLGLFFYHQGRDTWQVNERRITLALFHVFLAGFATVQHVVESRSQVHFDEDISLAIPTRLANKSIPRLRATLRSAGIAFVSFWATYVVIRRPVLRFILVNCAGPWARTHLYTLMKHSGAYSLTLAIRTISTSFLFLSLWEITNVIFEVYATQPMSISQFASNPNQSLLSGLRSRDPYYQQFAYLEFSLLTLNSQARREAIFKDVKRSSTGMGGSNGGAWSELSRECLVLMGTELQRAKGRGRIPVNVTGLNPTPVSSSSSTNDNNSPNKASVKSGDVFLPTRSTLFDKLATNASSSSLVAPSISSTAIGQKATTAVSSAISTAQTSIASRVPSILQTGSSSSNEGSSTAPPVMKIEDVPQVIGSEVKVAKWVPGNLRETLFGIEPEYRIGRCIPRVREVVCAVQALSNLTCASLKEDPYGVAQRDIPKILEGFVRYLDVLASLEREFELLAKEKQEEEVRERWRRVERDTVGVVQDALRQGARAILTEFAPYLSEFRFPTHIASQLQLLVDWGA
ncbi:nucleoporin NDC1 [Sporobolomyces salmoneus]|uniref:nucleoporin NDC1 n=1 Tax=Sporobolomyces salmoneus TaxID=183962 RepID=UPI00317614D0